MSQKLEVVFAEGCFDHLDMTQEEIDELKAEILSLAESGEMFEVALPLTEEEEEELMHMLAIQSANTRQ